MESSLASKSLCSWFGDSRDTGLLLGVAEPLPQTCSLPRRTGTLESKLLRT